MIVVSQVIEGQFFICEVLRVSEDGLFASLEIKQSTNNLFVGVYFPWSILKEAEKPSLWR